MNKNKSLAPLIIVLAVFALSVFLIVLDFSKELSCFEELISQPKELSSPQPKELSSPQPKELSSPRELSSQSSQKDIIAEKIEQGKEFLYRMENQEVHGFYKKYDAENDSFENRVHTVYSASIIYTFLYLYDYQKDEKILERLPEWGEFLLSMQDKETGAFHYSYYLDSQEKEQRFVVGTSALSIFTLLRLYEFTNEPKYLQGAKLTGDWLLTMQREDGGMRPYKRYSDGKWVYGKKESLLYNGQCLSALAKLYATTGQKKYYHAAEKIAKHFVQKYEDAGRQYIVGEYRAKNPISNSWVVMSLMDFYRASQKELSSSIEELSSFKKIIFEISSQIISHQMEDGRIDGAYSTSGNGWISEVMTETYRFCLEEKRDDCQKYKDTVVGIIGWLIDRTYTKENSSFLKNPKRAIGGVFWNKANKYVRTDSVCHALNGYLRIIDYLDKQSPLLKTEQELTQ